MALYLKQLSETDGIDIYNMLQNIGQDENEFKNPVKSMNYIEFKEWLVQQNQWAHEMNLPKGYVKQTIFWLYDDFIPVGIGKIRHYLTENSRKIGGNIGYAISMSERGKGYGTELLKLLKIKCDSMNIKERLLTVEKYNPASKRAIEKAGGSFIKEDKERWYFSI